MDKLLLLLWFGSRPGLLGRRWAAGTEECSDKSGEAEVETSIGREIVMEARGTERLVECFVFLAAPAYSFCTAESSEPREGKANDELLLMALSFKASSRSSVVLSSLLSSLGVPATKLFGFSF